MYVLCKVFFESCFHDGKHGHRSTGLGSDVFSRSEVLFSRKSLFHFIREIDVVVHNFLSVSVYFGNNACIDGNLCMVGYRVLLFCHAHDVFLDFLQFDFVHIRLLNQVEGNEVIVGLHVIE